MKWMIMAVLVLLVACAKAEPAPDATQPEVQGPVVLNVTEEATPDLCANVTCQEHESCLQGSCFCASGFKECAGSCIPSERCCSDADCDAQQSCENGSCQKSRYCDFNMKFDAETNSCVCESHSRYCKDQGKCIAFDSCCDIADCNPLGGNDRRCIQTKFTLQLCLNFNGGIHCRKAIVGDRTTYSYLQQSWDVYVDNLREGAVADLHAQRLGQNATFTIVQPNTTVTGVNLSIENKGGGLQGGSCETA